MNEKKKAPLTGGAANSAKVIHTTEQDSRKAAEMQGFIFTGEYFDGFPLYEFAPPPEGIPSINTAEGWEAMRHRFSRNRLIRELKREPSEQEIRKEMDRNAQEARKEIFEITGGKPEPALPCFGRRK